MVNKRGVMKGLSPNSADFSQVTKVAVSPLDDFIKANNSSDWGILKTEERYASLNTRLMAARFHRLYPDWTVEYMWDDRAVTFIPPNEKTGQGGSATIERVISRFDDGGVHVKKVRKYKLTESSYQRLRRFWNKTDVRSLAMSRPFVYQFVW